MEIEIVLGLTLLILLGIYVIYCVGAIILCIYHEVVNESRTRFHHEPNIFNAAIGIFSIVVLTIFLMLYSVLELIMPTIEWIKS